MALVSCPECGANVSQHAPVCPHCGYPFGRPTPPPIPQDPLESLAAAQQLTYAAPRQRPVYRHVQTVEATGKVWKAQMLLAALLAIGGAVVAMVAAGDRRQASPAMGFGILALIAGLVWFIIARIGAWWNHG